MRVYYQLDYSGIEHIPFGNPIVLAPNHVNAFIDPVIIAMLPSRKVRFFARGDVFKGKIAKILLNSLNISPMFRIQEGYSELKKNDQTFDECKRLLTENKAILLFPEGICVQEKRLRPLKKGLARIVFQTAQSFNYSKDIYIIPIGLNYEDAKRFRSKVYIHFGKPMLASHYMEGFKKDPVRTINEFTKQLEEQMKQCMVIINNPQYDLFAEGLTEIFVKEWMLKKEKDSTKPINRYESEKEIIAAINYFELENKTELEKLKDAVSEYFYLLKQHNLRDHLLQPETITKSNFATFLLEFIKLYLGYPVYALGVMMNYPPYYLAKKVAASKTKEIEFYASVYANLAMILWLLYFPLQLVIVALVIKNGFFLAMYAMLVPLTGFYVLMFYSTMQKILGRWRLLRLVRKNKQAVLQLVNLREKIIHSFKQMTHL